jgi:hypothetical protein
MPTTTTQTLTGCACCPVGLPCCPSDPTFPRVIYLTITDKSGVCVTCLPDSITLTWDSTVSRWRNLTGIPGGGCDRGSSPISVSLIPCADGLCNKFVAAISVIDAVALTATSLSPLLVEVPNRAWATCGNVGGPSDRATFTFSA